MLPDEMFTWLFRESSAFVYYTSCVILFREEYQQERLVPNQRRSKRRNQRVENFLRDAVRRQAGARAPRYPAQNTASDQIEPEKELCRGSSGEWQDRVRPTDLRNCRWRPVHQQLPRHGEEGVVGEDKE